MAEIGESLSLTFKISRSLGAIISGRNKMHDLSVKNAANAVSNNNLRIGEIMVWSPNFRQWKKAKMVAEYDKITNINLSPSKKISFQTQIISKGKPVESASLFTEKRKAFRITHESRQCNNPLESIGKIG